MNKREEGEGAKAEIRVLTKFPPFKVLRVLIRTVGLLCAKFQSLPWPTFIFLNTENSKKLNFCADISGNFPFL